jgi:hypothetical protein
VKHTISVPSVLTGRRVQWSFELSAERREIPLSIPTLVPVPGAPSVEQAMSSPVTVRGATPVFRLVLATLVVGVVVAALGLVRQLGAEEEYEVADSLFESPPSTDHGSTSEPIASAPAMSRAPAAAAGPIAAAPVTPSARQAAARQAVAEPEKTPPGKITRIVAVSATVPTTLATPAVDTHEPKEDAAAAADVSAIAISTPPAVPAAAAAPDEVTITGCLEIARDDDRFRLSDTEGASVPQGRSWRSGFRKRSAAVDLVGSTEAFTLSRQVGQRVAVSGVLSSRQLKVSSVRVVSPSCN